MLDALNDTGAPGSTGECTAGGFSAKDPPGSVTVQTNASQSALTPSLAATTTSNVPGSVGVPLITPVVPEIARPGGNPVAANPNTSPFGSDADMASVTAEPVRDDLSPGLTITGVTAGDGTGATPMRTIFATDGTP